MKYKNKGGIAIKVKFVDKVFLLTLLPIFIQMLLQSLVGIVDTFMVSALSDNSVAAVGSINKFLRIINELFYLISAGISVIIPQLIGAKKHKEAKDYVHNALVICGLIGIIMVVIITSTSPHIAGILNLPQGIRGEAVDYLFVMGFSYLFQPFVIILISIFQIYGMTKLSVIAIVISNIINIVGDYFVVFSPLNMSGFGVKGIAFTSVLGHAAASAILLTILIRKLHLNLSHKMNFRNLTTIIKVGIPSVAESVSYTLSQFIITLIIIRLGTVYLSANIYAMDIMYIISRMPLAVGILAGIITGKQVGRKEIQLAYISVKRNIFLAQLSTIILGIIPVMLSGSILRIFTNNTVIIKSAQMVMFFEFIILLVKSTNFVLGNSLRGSGDVHSPAWIGIFSMWGIGVTLSCLFSYIFTLGLLGIYLASFIDEAVRSILMGLRWLSKKWIHKALI